MRRLTDALIIKMLLCLLITIVPAGYAKDNSSIERAAQVTIRQKPQPGLRVVSGNLVYEEHLDKGGLRTRYWSPAGLIKPDVDLKEGDELPALDEPIACSFGLSVDGQELWDSWNWRSSEEVPCGGNCRHVVVELAHQIRPIRVKVHTIVDGNPFLRRWLEIHNDGQSVTAIGSIYPMSGYLFAARKLAENLPRDTHGAFSVLRPANFDWGKEADFRWMSLPIGNYAYGDSKHGLPFAVVKNAVSGENFLVHFGWSGHYTFEFYNDNYPGRDAAWLYFRVGIAGPGPFRVVNPGETVTTPSVYIGHTIDDLDTSVQAMHRYLRESVLPPMPPGRARPVEINSWGYDREDMSEEALKAEIDTAADVGVELLTIDAGWYGGGIGSGWGSAVGDWKTGSRLPRGLEPVFDYARRKGLMCGLWVDIERIGEGSQLRKQHPDWVVKVHGSTKRQTGLDFTNPEVVKFAEETLAGLIERYKLDVFRLDYNTDLGRGGVQTRHGDFIENNYWRHYDNLYAMYERLRRRFPSLMMENCASGGGRNDLGMLRNFHWAQVSDEFGGVRTLKILNGFSIAFPPEYGLSYVGVMSNENYRYGDVDFRFRGQMFGHLCLAGIAPNLTEFPATYRERVKHNVQLYKSFIRPVLPTVKVYHHTPIAPQNEPGDWTVLEHATPDRTRGYAGVFRLAGAKEDTYLFRPRGLDPGKTYKVTFDNTGDVARVSGLQLQRDGLTVRIGQPLRSELMLFEAEDVR
ncbi:MAG: alpha-galactosidase [Bryobacteraceae bacterium]